MRDLAGVAGIILCMGWANERRHYYVMPSLIGWAHTQNDPWEGMLIHNGVDWGIIVMWCHMNIMVSPITTKYTACPIDFQVDNKGNIKYSYKWLFVGYFHLWLVDFTHKGPVIQRTFPYCDLIVVTWDIRVFSPLKGGLCWLLECLPGRKWVSSYFVNLLRYTMGGWLGFILPVIVYIMSLRWYAV